MTQVLEFLSARSRRKWAAPLSERTVVVNGAAGARIKVSSGRGAGSWRFRWSEVSHFSHREGHFWNSDAILVELRGEPRRMAIPTEARGAREFFEALLRHCPEPARWQSPRTKTGAGGH